MESIFRQTPHTSDPYVNIGRIVVSNNLKAALTGILFNLNLLLRAKIAQGALQDKFLRVDRKLPLDFMLTPR